MYELLVGECQTVRINGVSVERGSTVPCYVFHCKVHGNFHVPCLMFGKRKKNLTEVTSITDKFANRFQNWLTLKNSGCLMPKENCLLHPDQKRTFRLTFYHVCSLPYRKQFYVLVLQRTVIKKCTKIYSARAQLLFCSLNLLFSDVFPFPSSSWLA